MVRSIILLVAGLVSGAVLFSTFGEPGGVSTMSSSSAPEDEWFKKEVVNSKLPVIVDFTATWCGPCKAMKKDLDKLEQEFVGKFKVVPVDIDERPEISDHYNVDGVPTLLILKRGKVVAKRDGVDGGSDTYEGLKQFVTRHL
ncbi:thioredoxin family protein [Planctomicrobium piriforme]|uniref:Thioredoxin n=1 Tax=Planctomicrobium piriforme TaxID=1576369 RepID=A0A1I3JWK0_9PLAN|nr:thioredoxin family protein [Planctomicrobium piriforme]SFI64649.1 thioredoxin [Planctomicrobium piriforme]